MEQSPLRYIDGPGTEVDTVIAAAPERVWALVTDVSLSARFSSEFQGGEWIEGATGPALGARFVGRNRHPAVGEWETTSTVTDCSEATVFAWAVGDPDHPSATWRFDLTPAPEGAVLRMSMRIGPARSGISPAIDAMPDKESRILERRLAEHRTNMQATLAGIKELAEAASAGSQS